MLQMSTWLTVVPVISWIGVFGTSLYMTLANPIVFDFVPKPMLEARYFIVRVPKTMARSTYIAIKSVVLAGLSFGGLELFMQGSRANKAFKREAKESQDAVKYKRPSAEQVEAWDQFTNSNSELL